MEYYLSAASTTAKKPSQPCGLTFLKHCSICGVCPGVWVYAHGRKSKSQKKKKKKQIPELLIPVTPVAVLAALAALAPALAISLF